MANESLQNEYAIIHCCLTNKQVAIRCIGELTSKDFSSPQCEEAFGQIREAINSGENIDETILKNKLNSKDFTRIYNQFIKVVPTNYEYISEYIAICKEASKKRRIGELMMKTQSTIGDKTVSELVVDIENELIGIQHEHYSQITTLYEEIEPIKANINTEPDVNRLITTGLEVIDSRLSIDDGTLTLIAGRPSMGKTAFMLHMVQHACMKGQKVLVFSIEMTKRELSKRLIASSSGIELWKMIKSKKNAFTDSDWKKFKDWEMKVAPTLMKNVYIDDQANSIDQIVSMSRSHFIKEPFSAIFIDHIGLMVLGDEANKELSMISRMLKVGLAKPLNIPVIALSQLSRAVELREDKRPIPSDLRDSGSLEQNSDIVMFCYREGYYDRSKDNNDMDLIIGKQRNGETFEQKIGYNRKTQKFGEFPKK